MVKSRFLFVTFFFLLTMSISDVFGQADSLWSVMLLKKGNTPEMKDNMAEYSETGFFLYKNCFYNIELQNAPQKTMRLVDIKQDTLVFVGISHKTDVNTTLQSTDSTIVDYRQIKVIHLPKGGGTFAKNIICNKYYFIFSQFSMNYKIESKYANIFAPQEVMTELVPQMTANGVMYHFEFNGKLYYHSGINVQTPKYSDEEKVLALSGIVGVLDLLVNKRVSITIPIKRQEKTEQENK